MRTRKIGILSAALLGGLMAGNQAMATPFSFDPDGLGGDAAANTGSIDWAVGNALSNHGNDAFFAFLGTATANVLGGGITVYTPNAGTVQTVFTTYYQAKLSTIRSITNTDITPVDFQSGGTKQLTAVAAIQEHITSILVDSVAGTSTASFVINGPVTPGVPTANNFLEIWYNTAQNADDLAGLNFNTSKLILTGTVDAGSSNFTRNGGGAGTPLDAFGGTDNYPLIDSVTGNGSTNLNGQIGAGNYDSNFFLNEIVNFTFFQTTQSLNFGMVDPSAHFAELPGGVAPILDGAGLGVASLGTVNGGNGPDVQFQADGSSTFDVTGGGVPEPVTATMALLSLGALGMVISRRRTA